MSNFTMNLKKYITIENPIIVEVGSNDGSTTQEFLDMFPDSSVFCFEPDKKALSKFYKRNFSNQVKIFEFAISNKIGIENFYVADNTLSGSLSEPLLHLEIYPQIKFENLVSVHVRTLDSIFKDFEKINLIQVDAQGSELKVFEGGRETLEKTEYIYCEFSNLELYKGAMNKEQTMNALGTDWELILIDFEWMADGNLFARNKKFFQ